MRAGDNEVNDVWRDFFENRAQVPGDIDTAASLVWVMERVVVEERVKRILLEKADAFIRSFLF